MSDGHSFPRHFRTVIRSTPIVCAISTSVMPASHASRATDSASAIASFKPLRADRNLRPARSNSVTWIPFLLPARATADTRWGTSRGSRRNRCSDPTWGLSLAGVPLPGWGAEPGGSSEARLPVRVAHRLGDEGFPNGLEAVPVAHEGGDSGGVNRAHLLLDANLDNLAELGGGDACRHGRPLSGRAGGQGGLPRESVCVGLAYVENSTRTDVELSTPRYGRFHD